MATDNALQSRRIRLGDRYLTVEEIEALMGRAVRNALADHKRAGNPVAAWRDGKVVIVQPEEIELPELNEP